LIQIPGEIPPPADMPPDRASAARPLTGHISVLDGLRGLAILLVLLCHFVNYDVLGTGSVISRASAKVIAAGWIGVDLFFVLSGFLITGILLRTKKDRGYFRKFYMRRLLRVFPLYYAALAVTFVVFPMLSAPLRARAAQIGHDQIFLWTYTTNLPWIFRGRFFEYPGLDHFWSLAVEEHFYLLWPAIVLLLRPRTLAAACVAIMAAAVVIRIALWHHHLPAWSIYSFTLSRMDALAMGGLIAVVIDRRGVRGWLIRAAKGVGLLSLAMLITVAIIAHNFDADTKIVQWIGFSFVAFGWGAALILILPSTGQVNPVGRVFENPMMRAIGKYSYAMYVLHIMVRDMLVERFRVAARVADACHSPLLGVTTAIVVGIAITFCVAWLSYHLFEKQFLALKRFFNYDKGRPDATGASSKPFDRQKASV
jgi:peptidoglycan/LPS O-acetylase OafA/YrhL